MKIQRLNPFLYGHWFAIKDDPTKWRTFWLFVVLAYAFAVVLRMTWVYQVDGMSTYKWNNEIMINTNDGYFYAQGAKDILDGKKLFERSPTGEGIARLTAFLSQVLPISFETLILHMPSVFGSLLVVPIMLIARALAINYVGFMAALIGGIAWSYYNRTMVGYYDTDMLTVVFPALITAFGVYGLRHKSFWVLVGLLPLILAYKSWYSGLFFYVPFLMVLLGYILVFDRHSRYNYCFLTFYAIGMSNLGVELSLGLYAFVLSVSYVVLCQANWLEGKGLKPKIIDIGLMAVIALLVLYTFITGGILAYFYSQLEAYVFRKIVADDIRLVFFNVVQTVREAGQIPFEVFAKRISGSVLAFWLSSLGVVMLVLRYPIMVLSLPLVVAGFVALQGGLRFTVYAVPIYALGLGFLMAYVGTYFYKFLSKLHSNIWLPRVGFLSLLCALGIGALKPHVVHIRNYMVPTVFSQKEVALLDTIKDQIDEQDYMMAWWDYGYPIHFYGQLQTLIDGGRHNGDDNFLVSFALSKSQVPAANMLRLSAEFDQANQKDPKVGTLVEQMMRFYGFKNANNFLNALDTKSFDVPSATRDVFLYLPYRMMNIFPTVTSFSNLDLTTGRTFSPPVFFHSKILQNTPEAFLLSQDTRVLLQNNVPTGEIQIGNQKLPIRFFIQTYYEAPGKPLQKRGQVYNPNASLDVIYMVNYNKILVLDQNAFYSTYVQLFVLEDYDRTLYEPVAIDPEVKIFRLKI